MHKLTAIMFAAAFAAVTAAAWHGPVSPEQVIYKWDSLAKGNPSVAAHVGEQPAGLIATAPQTGAMALKAPGHIVTLPWSEDFSDPEAAREAFCVADVNDDGRTWQIETGRAYALYHLNNAADDWLFTPGLPLEAGKTYHLAFETHCSAGYPERLEVKMGTAADVASMATTILEPLDITWGDDDDRRFRSVDFTASTTGTAYIGFHAVSDANKNKLSLTSVSLADVATIAPDPIYVTCYSEDFSSQEAARSQFTVIDSNNDKSTWIFETGRACYDYSRQNQADDWLITPAISLAGGKTYTLRFEIYARSTTWAERVEVKAGNAPQAAAMTTAVIEPMDVVWTEKDKRRFIETEYTPLADGLLHLGIHVISEANRYNLYVAGIKVLQAVDEAPPAGVGDLTVTPDPMGDLTAVVGFTAPMQRADGTPLDALDRIELKRNGELVKCFTPVSPGQKCTFADNVPAPGDYRYDATPFSATDPGDAVSVSVYVGPNVTVAPGGVGIVESATDPGMVTMSWTAPQVDVDGNAVNQANVTYTILEFLGDSFATVATGIGGTSHTFRAIAPGLQEFKTFVVTAVTSRGMSYPGVAPTLAVGTPYDMPVKMSFTDDDLAGCCIATYVEHDGCDWNILLDNSGLVSQDRDDASMTFSGDKAGDKGELWLGKTRVPADAVNPVLSYWVYKVDVDDDNFCSAYVVADGREIMLETTPIADLENVGWN
ncbi:MAG: choice-of-anchor J domain-containing protein, partial [Muribaculaceae bacterium]|nr:choice-of-anchor J domain-containing protein [Muribaculaceae bacterium]